MIKLTNNIEDVYKFVENKRFDKGLLDYFVHFIKLYKIPVYKLSYIKENLFICFMEELDSIIQIDESATLSFFRSNPYTKYDNPIKMAYGCYLGFFSYKYRHFEYLRLTELRGKGLNISEQVNIIQKEWKEKMINQSLI